MTHCLFAIQLSNYDRNGVYHLHADSSWNMTQNKLREMLRIDPEFTADVLVPLEKDVAIQPEVLTKDIPGIERVTFLRQGLPPNAARTRYDFRYQEISDLLRSRPKYTHVYIMDPMHVRNYKAIFHLDLKYRPKFICNSHFIDDPSNPVVGEEIQYWYGQVEGHIKADLNVWQCSAAQKVFEDAARKSGFSSSLVDSIIAKSYAWDAGYSHTEMSAPIDEARATRRFLRSIPKDKIVVFAPNRVGGALNGQFRSSDYTNVGKFLFEIVPEVWKKRQDFCVIAGNPNQKITNTELEEHVPGYLRLLEDGTFEREEYLYVARNSDIVIGFFSVDSYGGTGVRECTDQGCMPLFTDCYEQHTMLEACNWPKELRVAKDFSNAIDAFEKTLDYVKQRGRNNQLQKQMCDYVIKNAAFENTTEFAMKSMGMI